MANSENANVLLEHIAELFSKKDFPDTCAKTFIAAPEIPSSVWSMGNQIVMMFGDTHDARGYRQWERVGRYVKKGSKALYILGPMTIKRKDSKTDEMRQVCIGFRCIPVFRYEDTDGKPLEEYKPKELPPLFDLAKKQGIEIKWTNTHHGEYGSINPKTGQMTLSTEAPDTFLHELVHWYDNKSNPLKLGQDKTQEAVAQLGACVLAKMYGHDVLAHSWSYIAGYAESKEPRVVGALCYKVLGRVQTAISAILTDAQSGIIQPVQMSKGVDCV